MACTFAGNLLGSEQYHIIQLNNRSVKDRSFQEKLKVSGLSLPAYDKTSFSEVVLCSYISHTAGVYKQGTY